MHEVEPPDQGELSPRTRLALFHGSSTSVNDALNVEMFSMTPADLRARGITADNIRSVGTRMDLLKKIGLKSVDDLREIGLDALDLNDLEFCAQCVGEYGANSVRSSFLVNASDAVALAGTQAAQLLGVTAAHLLDAAAGDAMAAKTALKLMGTTALKTVTLSTLLNTGMQAKALAECGYEFSFLMKHFKPSPSEALLLGINPMR